MPFHHPEEPVFQMIAFDADDTLWHNEAWFTLTQTKFAELLAPYHDTDWVAKRLHETQIRNLALFGYGIKGFTLSMIETAVELTEGRISGAEIHQLVEAGKHMLKAPVEPLPHVEQTLKGLVDQGRRLMLITKGDLFDQESKLARSGLGDYFHTVEVVSEKNTTVYRDLFRRHQLNPERLMMIGNSLKSDVLPVLPLSTHAVHIPYETTWVHEQVSPTELEGKTFHHLDHMGALPPLIARLEAEVH